MKLGITGPVSLQMLAGHVDMGADLPEGYKFAPMATWVEALLDRGHHISLFTSAPGIAEPLTFIGPRLTIHVGRHRDRHRARDCYALERQDLFRAMRSDPCDLIHAHWTYEFALAALDTGRPVLVTAHDAPLQVLRYHRPISYWSVRALMAYQVAQRTKHMTAVSSYVADHFRRVMCYRGVLSVISNAVPHDAIALGRTMIRQTERPLTFACVLCGWGQLKNGKVALQAFRGVLEHIPSAKLLMFGEGHGYGEEAINWASSRNLCKGVEFCGRIAYADLLRRLGSEVDILVHPSLEESFSMVVAEALALGMPVVAGIRSGGVVEVLENGHCGLLVDVRSPREVADAMLSLSDPGVRSRYAERGKHAVEARFTSETVFDAYEAAYRNCLQENDPIRM